MSELRKGNLKTQQPTIGMCKDVRDTKMLTPASKDSITNEDNSTTPYTRKAPAKGNLGGEASR